jgi:hypothetical protein
MRHTAPVAEGIGLQAAARPIETLHGGAHLIASRDGPILLDCKVNGNIRGIRKTPCQRRPRHEPDAKAANNI